MHIFISSIENSRSMDISHIDFGPQTLFLGLQGLFSPKIIFFMLHTKFLIDKYIRWTYWLLTLKAFLGLKGLFWPFWPFFLAPYKIPNLWIHHITILILEPKFHFRFIPPFWLLKSYLFLLYTKFLKDGYITDWAPPPNSVLELLFLSSSWTYFCLFDPKNHSFSYSI
jgi:hypothetical protein